MPVYRFECRSCEYAEDLFFKVSGLPRVRRCPSCGKRKMAQDFGAPRVAQINENSSLYGKWHPQAGEVIRDRAHKHELMRRYGWTEAGDPVGGNRKLSEESLHQDTQPAPSMDGMSWGGAEEKLSSLQEVRDKLRHDHAETPVKIA